MWPGRLRLGGERCVRLTTLESEGFAEGKASARCFDRPEHDLRCVVHGGNFAFAGRDEDLGRIQNVVEEHSTCK
eukprot:3819560-Alexandrium_andersonii.AAC.1